MDEEEIVVHPPIDRIPDEYEHFAEDSDNNFNVYIFSISDPEAKNKVKCFREALGEKNFKFLEHSLETDDCDDILNKIAESNTSASGLILFFCGKSNSDGELKMFDGKKVDYFVLHDIWTKFYSQNCLNLKNKPKIFIFELSVSSAVQSDGQKRSRPPPPYELTYDTPNEADILILFHRTRDDGDDDYIENFCENIKTYGKSEDITVLATCVASSLYVPMLISTFTRKFYFSASNYRGHNHNITEKQKLCSEELSKIKNMLVFKEPEKLKSKPSFIKKLFKNGSSGSFREKEKASKVKLVPPESVPDKAGSSNVMEKSGKSTSSRKESVTESEVKDVKMKTPVMRRNDMRRKSRSVSTTSEDLKKLDKKKPMWKF